MGTQGNSHGEVRSTPRSSGIASRAHSLRSVRKRLNLWIENNIWPASLIVTVVLSPAIFWAEWDTFEAIGGIPLRLLIFLVTLLGFYISLGVTLMWNRWIQRKYREWGIIKSRR